MQDEIAVTQMDHVEQNGTATKVPVSNDAPSLPQATITMLAEMDTAIADEIADKSKHRSDYGRVAHNGMLIERTTTHFLYDFTLDELWEPDEGTPLSIQVPGAPNVRASIVSAAGLVIRIAAESELPPSALDQIRLNDDPTQLLEQLQNALKSNTEGATLLGSKTLARHSFNNARRETASEYPGFEPRESQRNAIKLSLGSEVAFIIGPPGTGKTATLAAMAYALVYEGRSVLIAAHTNIAVDNAIVKLADMCKQANLPALREGHVIRYGNPQLEAVKKRADIYPKAIAKRLSAELSQQLEELESQHAQATEQLKDSTDLSKRQSAEWQTQRAHILAQQASARNELDSLLAQEHERVARIDAELGTVGTAYTYAEQRLETVRRALTQLVARQSQTEAAHAQHLATIGDLAAHLTDAQQMNAVVRLLRGMNVEQIARRLADAKQLVWADEQALQEIQAKLDSAHQQVATMQREWQQLRTQLDELNIQRQTPTVLGARLAALRAALATADQQIADGDRAEEAQTSVLAKEQASCGATITDLSQRIAEINEQLHDIEQRLLDEALVVATTLTSVYMAKRLRERRFDYVIMDEVSMAPLPSVYIAASRADTGVVAFGDPRQLAPIASSEKPSVIKWLKRDLFGLAGVDLNKARTDGKSELLNEQFRMHPDISAISGKHVYEGLVQDGYDSHKGLNYERVSPSPGHQLVLCDTSDSGAVTSKPSRGTGRFNLYHALCALALAREILATLPDKKPDQDKPHRVGIVTPYAAQARLIQRMVKADDLQGIVRVGTVHRFQGLEFEAIIFDTVESLPIAPYLPFIGGGPRSEGQRLVNVAVTRAQHKLVIIANARYIDRAFGKGDTLRLAVDEARKAQVLPSREIVGILGANLHQSLLGERFREHSATGSPIAFEPLNEETFFDRFYQDVRAAKSSIVIFGPFVRTGRATQVAAELEAKSRDGVRITVVASNDYKKSAIDDAARKAIEDAGVIFRTSEGMHEKVIFIDDTVLYFGSLNPLSHGATTEFMARFVSHEMVQAVGKSINAPVRADPRQWGKDFAVFLNDVPVDGGACPKCGGKLRLKPGKYGPFYGCSNYRRDDPTSCGYIQEITTEILAQVRALTNVPCDKCKAGIMRPQASRKDRWLECAAPSPCGHRRKIVIE